MILETEHGKSKASKSICKGIHRGYLMRNRTECAKNSSKTWASLTHSVRAIRHVEERAIDHLLI